MSICGGSIYIVPLQSSLETAAFWDKLSRQMFDARAMYVKREMIFEYCSSFHKMHLDITLLINLHTSINAVIITSLPVVYFSFYKMLFGYLRRLARLVSFVQFKKLELHPSMSVTFSKVPSFSLQLYLYWK